MTAFTPGRHAARLERQLRWVKRRFHIVPLRALAREFGAPADIAGFVLWMKRLELAARTRLEARLAAATPRFEPTPAEREEFNRASRPSDLRQGARSSSAKSAHSARPR
jgi:hypothetical protein